MKEKEEEKEKEKERKDKDKEKERKIKRRGETAIVKVVFRGVIGFSLFSFLHRSIYELRDEATSFGSRVAAV